MSHTASVPRVNSALWWPFPVLLQMVHQYLVLWSGMLGQKNILVSRKHWTTAFLKANIICVKRLTLTDSLLCWLLQDTLFILRQQRSTWKTFDHSYILMTTTIRILPNSSCNYSLFGWILQITILYSSNITTNTINSTQATWYITIYINNSSMHTTEQLVDYPEYSITIKLLTIMHPHTVNTYSLKFCCNVKFINLYNNTHSNY